MWLGFSSLAYLRCCSFGWGRVGVRDRDRDRVRVRVRVRGRVGVRVRVRSTTCLRQLAQLLSPLLALVLVVVGEVEPVDQPRRERAGAERARGRVLRAVRSLVITLLAIALRVHVAQQKGVPG